ncbi:MAG: exo-alpha-sialidase [Deltaproteobacteria bacterium]|nr:exo-alpha-sialidase [Deltaproteobacteria bacterium]
MTLLLALVLRLVCLAALAVSAAAAWWWLRPNRARVRPSLGVESWSVVADGRHNSNTDLIYWRESFWLVHAASPWHLGSTECRLRIWRSADARRFEPVAELGMPGEDIRDPKLAVIGGRLFLYALPNRGRAALPYTTVYSVSDDGITWPAFTPIEQPGWLFWRPKTRDGVTWWVTAYWHGHGRSRLFSSTDGIHWSVVSDIHEGDANDETDFEILSDGRMLVTARLEGRADSPLGSPDACTLLATSAPPYQAWTKKRSSVTRLDGPALFSYRGAVLAVGRFQPGPRGPLTQLGGVLSRKRTALFLVEEDRLVHLTDLPSAGDTSYAGVVVEGHALTTSYYTSDVTRDYAWLLGMFLPTEIRIARIDLDGVLRLAESLKRTPP